MNVKLFFLGVMITLSIFAMVRPGRSYPPSVGIFSKAKNCLACHANNDPWQDDGRTIIDIVDKASGRSLGQKDGAFLIEAKQGQAVTVLAVMGRAKDDSLPPSSRKG